MSLFWLIFSRIGLERFVQRRGQPIRISGWPLLRIKRVRWRHASAVTRLSETWDSRVFSWIINYSSIHHLLENISTAGTPFHRCFLFSLYGFVMKKSKENQGIIRCSFIVKALIHQKSLNGSRWAKRNSTEQTVLWRQWSQSFTIMSHCSRVTYPWYTPTILFCCTLKDGYSVRALMIIIRSFSFLQLATAVREGMSRCMQRTYIWNSFQREPQNFLTILSCTRFHLLP